MIIHTYLSEMKNKTLPACLQGNYRDSLGEFSNMSHGLFGAEREKGITQAEFSKLGILISDKKGQKNKESLIVARIDEKIGV